MTDIEMNDILDTLRTHRRNLIEKAVEAAIKTKGEENKEASDYYMRASGIDDAIQIIKAYDFKVVK